MVLMRMDTVRIFSLSEQLMLPAAFEAIHFPP